MARFDAGELAIRLGRQAEAVCRHYLSNGCGFRKFPDTDFSNSRTRVSVNTGQRFR